jgi:hypothetical protein
MLAALFVRRVRRIEGHLFRLLNRPRQRTGAIGPQRELIAEVVLMALV